jgi:hypothetical protein
MKRTIATLIAGLFATAAFAQTPAPASTGVTTPAAAKADAKVAKAESKAEVKQAKADAKANVKEAKVEGKAEVKEAKADAKETKQEAKAEVKEAKADAKAQKKVARHHPMVKQDATVASATTTATAPTTVAK